MNPMMRRSVLLAVAVMVVGSSGQSSNMGRLLALQQCAAQVQAFCQSVQITDLEAVAECLQTHRDDISTSCASVLEPFIRQEGADGELDQEVVDQETEESASHIEAEDEICDAKFIASCRSQFFMAVYSHDTTALVTCAREHVSTVGQACLAMVQNGDADGLLSHMYHCGQRALNTCPVEAMALATETALGLEEVQAPTLLSLISCLRGETHSLREGCSGFVNSVADVVASLSQQASDRFNDEEAASSSTAQPTDGGATKPDPVITPAPAPAQQPQDDSDDSGKKAHHPDNNGGDQKPSVSDDEDSSNDDGSEHKSFLVPGLLIALACVLGLAVAGAAAVFIYRRRWQNHTDLVSMHVSMTDGPSQISDESQGFIMGSGYGKLDGAV
jgi:hypothetical protein